MSIRGIGVEGVCSQIGAYSGEDFEVDYDELVSGIMNRFEATEVEAEEAIEKALDCKAVYKKDNKIKLFMSIFLKTDLTCYEEIDIIAHSMKEYYNNDRMNLFIDNVALEAKEFEGLYELMVLWDEQKYNFEKTKIIKDMFILVYVDIPD